LDLAERERAADDWPHLQWVILAGVKCRAAVPDTAGSELEASEELAHNREIDVA
jgi:hypothetical protein